MKAGYRYEILGRLKRHEKMSIYWRSRVQITLSIAEYAT